MFLISALDRSSDVLSWVGAKFSISLAIPFSKHHFFQTDNQKAVLLTVFSLLELFFSCGGERNPTQNTGHCFARNFSNYQIFKFFLWHPRLAFDWLSVSFFDYSPIRMSGLLLLLHWINPLLHWISWKLHLS